MKNSEKNTQKLIRKKTSTYLKNAIMIFLLTIAALLYGILFFCNFKQENDKNFVQNDMVHFIQVTGKMDGNEYLNLTNKDYKNINSLEKNLTQDFLEIAFYQFVGAINSDTDEPVLLVGIHPTYSNYISDEIITDHVFYTNEKISKDTLTLLVPKIEVDENGNLHSDSNLEISYQLNHSVMPENQSDLLHLRSADEPVQTVFVTYDTLLEIMKNTGLIDKNIYDITDEANPQIIYPSDIVIYVDDMYKIDDCAQILLDSNYMLNYTFEAFDSLSATLKKSSLFFVILVILLLVTSGINVFISFREYLRMQQKDMGILKFYGYSSKQICSIYIKNMNWIFRLCFSILTIYLLILGVCIEMDNIWNVILIMIGIVILILTILKLLIINISLKKYVNKNILYLIKNSKEFE